MNIATARTMLAPLAMLNRRTATPLLIYMAAGASGLAVVAETFWIRERLALSPQALFGTGGVADGSLDAEDGVRPPRGHGAGAGVGARTIGLVDWAW